MATLLVGWKSGFKSENTETDCLEYWQAKLGVDGSDIVIYLLLLVWLFGRPWGGGAVHAASGPHQHLQAGQPGQRPVPAQPGLCAPLHLLLLRAQASAGRVWHPGLALICLVHRSQSGTHQAVSGTLD